MPTIDQRRNKQGYPQPQHSNRLGMPFEDTPNTSKCEETALTTQFTEPAPADLPMSGKRNCFPLEQATTSRFSPQRRTVPPSRVSAAPGRRGNQRQTP
eukprot:6181815-Pleurochrysis_carterae.AAC.1